MIAIETRYKPADGDKGTRIIAETCIKLIEVGYDYALDNTENHEAAANKMLGELIKAGEIEVNTELVHGVLPNGNHCHVIVPWHVPDEDEDGNSY